MVGRLYDASSAMSLAWTPNPADPEVFHITHVDNLPGIIANGLLSDIAVCNGLAAPRVIGDPSIKSRRLTWELRLHDRPAVGSFVLFYFCPRSVMLYRVWRDRKQPGVVHLVTRASTLQRFGRRCVFTDANAASGYASAFEDLARMSTELDWNAFPQTRWQGVKSERQAEFLVADLVPWAALELVAVQDQATLVRVGGLLSSASHRPAARLEPTWYYS